MGKPLCPTQAVSAGPTGGQSHGWPVPRVLQETPWLPAAYWGNVPGTAGTLPSHSSPHRRATPSDPPLFLGRFQGCQSCALHLSARRQSLRDCKNTRYTHTKELLASKPMGRPPSWVPGTTSRFEKQRAKHHFPEAVEVPARCSEHLRTHRSLSAPRRPGVLGSSPLVSTTRSPSHKERATEAVPHPTPRYGHMFIRPVPSITTQGFVPERPSPTSPRLTAYDGGSLHRRPPRHARPRWARAPRSLV